MGFKENLKAELNFSGMLVKELAARSGVKKKTLDSYMGNKSYTPSAENAVKIAKALGVSVEYLVTGKDTTQKISRSVLPSDMQEILQVTKQLNSKDRDVILNLARYLKKR